MQLTKHSNIYLCMKHKEEALIFRNVLAGLGCKKVTIFHSINLCYEQAIREHVDLFICSIEQHEAPGVTLLQRIRSSGNYGLEPFFFAGKSLDQSTMNIFSEYDIEYVITKPFTDSKISEKLKFLFKNENHLSVMDQIYRQSKAAYNSKMYAMALDLIDNAGSDATKHEKWEILKGDCFLQLKQLDLAEAHFKSALAINSGSVAAKNKLAKVLMRRHRYDDATEILDRLTIENPYHIQVLENAGLSNFELGKVSLSKKQMEQLRSIDETNKVADELKVKINVVSGHLDNAALILSKRHTEKEIVSLLNNAGIMLSKGHDVPGALNIYHQVLGIVTKQEYIGKIHYNIALAYMRIKDHKKALNHARYACSAIPNFEKAIAIADRMQENIQAAG